MNHLARRCSAAILLVALCLPWVGAIAHADAAPSPSGVAISQPQNGDAMVNVSPQISGTAPPQTLVLVSMVDTDTGRGGVKHQPNGRIDGSVTSDANGQWVFVPQVDVVPGSFEVVASYVTDEGKTVQSAPMRFVVVNESGASAEPTTGFKWMVALVLLAVVLAIGFVIFRVVRKRRHPSGPEGHRRFWPRRAPRGVEPPPSMPVAHAEAPRSARRAPERLESTRVPTRDVPVGWEELAPVNVGAPLFINTAAGRAYQEEQERKLRAMEAEMQSIERALAATAESLEQSNSTIISLRRQLHRDLREDLPRVDIGSPERRADRNGERGWVPVERAKPSSNGHFVP
jgi:hypothetical protein